MLFIIKDSGLSSDWLSRSAEVEFIDLVKTCVFRGLLWLSEKYCNAFSLFLEEHRDYDSNNGRIFGLRLFLLSVFFCV